TKQHDKAADTQTKRNPTYIPNTPSHLCRTPRPVLHKHSKIQTQTHQQQHNPHHKPQPTKPQNQKNNPKKTPTTKKTKNKTNKKQKKQ
ncbi:hypothetical protein, partial [Yersinia rohdei]|uniref:hypothetical protein n=1 Tax=Yersinia rohdei TaxID=29485 RepID=UPI001C96DD08